MLANSTEDESLTSATAKKYVGILINPHVCLGKESAMKVSFWSDK